MATEDRIEIRDLHLRTLVGFKEHELTKRQDVVLDLTLFLDTTKAGESDDVADSVDYRTVTKRVIALVEGGRFLLIEKLAAEVAKVCLEDARVTRVRVSVDKPRALRFARSVAIVIERSRDGA